MKWCGETHQQWLKRTVNWHDTFAYLPKQLITGEWVWLRHHRTRRVPTAQGGWYFEHCEDVASQPPERQRPSPPRSIKHVNSPLNPFDNEEGK